MIDNMIEIDGSYGEGGGAILRITTALSALTSQPVHITNIRSGRPKPGLMPQHLNAVKVVAMLTNATVQGLELGSTELFFNPGAMSGGDFNLDIGTAGSITLILQAFMIPAAFADGPSTIKVTGGTDVRWSPSIDYLEHVSLPILKLMGYSVKMNLIQRGHYPLGGGIIKLQIDPVKRLKPVKLMDLQFDTIMGVSHSVKLPEHVAIRQARSAEKILEKAGYKTEIEIQQSNNARDPGSGIFLWTNGKTPVSGGSIGKPGKKAEIVGTLAAEEILDQIKNGSAIDKYMGDQIIPYMAIAGNSTVKISELTEHTLTNIHITEFFIDKKFEVDGILGQSAVISVK